MLLAAPDWSEYLFAELTPLEGAVRSSFHPAAAATSVRKEAAHVRHGALHLSMFTQRAFADISICVCSQSNYV